MSTKADFYVGVGKNAEWIGSIVHNADPDEFDDPILTARSEKVFRLAIKELLDNRCDSIYPGSPKAQPLGNNAADYTYYFNKFQVRARDAKGNLFIPSEERVWNALVALTSSVCARTAG